MKIALIADENSSWLSYSANFIFTEFSGLEFKVFGLEMKYPSDYFPVSYLEQGNELSGIPNIVKETSDFELDKYVLLNKYHSVLSDYNEALLCQIDIFIATMHFLTGTFFESSCKTDIHQRIYSGYQEQLDILNKIPLLDYIIFDFYKSLRNFYPNITEVNVPVKYEIGIDVDLPWKFKHRGWLRQTAILFKAIFKNDSETVRLYWKKITTQKDPFDTYSEIIQMFGSENCRFFFLGENKSKYDGTHSFAHPAYKKLIKSISNTGYSIGIHPGYFSFKDGPKIKGLKEQIEAIIGQKIISSRMHFLRWQNPDTPEALIKAGITEDFTAGMALETGFMYGTTRPFFWYNTQESHCTILKRFPFVAMDRTLNTVLKLNTEEALQRLIDLKEKVQYCGGTIRIICHNTTFSETYDWKGWSMVFKKFKATF